MKDFDIEKLEKKNIYKVPDNLFENLQKNVLEDIETHQKPTTTKIGWAYAMAASIALIFGITFAYNSFSKDSKVLDNKNAYAIVKTMPQKESEIAYETLADDITAVEKVKETNTNKVGFMAENDKKTTNKINNQPTQSKHVEKQMNELLDNFSTSEIAELANNSTQDVYLDLYN